MKRLVLVSLVLLLSVSLFAQEQQQQMSAEDQKMMELYMKAATPGAEHKMLDGMIGTWNAKVSWYAKPGAPPMVSEGVSENTWVLGGRFVEQRFTGTMMGAPFEGIGYSGYDNVKKQYWGTWIDNMATGYMRTTGAPAAGGQVWNFDSVASDPMTGKDMKTKEKMYVKSADEFVWEMWSATPGGKPGSMYKALEIVYTRKK